LLLAEILSLPLIGMALSHIPWLSKRLAENAAPVRRLTASILSVVILLDSLLLWFILAKPLIHVTTERPRELLAAASWLKQQPANSSVVMTSMNYRAFFLPLLDKQLFGRYVIVMNYWTPLHYVREWLRQNPADLLLVGADDGADLNALLSVADFKLESKPAFRSGYLSAYRVRKGTFSIRQTNQTNPCLWYPQPGLRTLFQPVREKPFSAECLP
jgi:hypothetical protein